MSLYDPVLVRHARKPYGFGRLEATAEAGTTACDTNRPCGDRICFHVAASGAEATLAVRFEGEGCALALGAASALCEAVDGRPLDEAQRVVSDFRQSLAAPADHSQGDEADPTSSRVLGDLAHFAQVRAFPARVACVTLGSAVLSFALDRLTPRGGPDDRRDHER